MTWRRIISKLFSGSIASCCARRQRTERRIAAAEIGAVQLRQVIDMRAGIGEGAGLGQPPLEIDDFANRRQPLRRLDDFPALAVAKAELQHVEVQCRVEVVAVGPVAVDVLDPGDDAAVELDVVVDRHRQHFAIAAAGRSGSRRRSRSWAGRGSRPAIRIATRPRASRRWCRSPARRAQSRDRP